MLWTSIEDGDDGSEQRRPRFVVEGDNHAGFGQSRRLPIHAATVAVTSVGDRPIGGQFVRFHLIEFVGGIRVASFRHQRLGDVAGSGNGR